MEEDVCPWWMGYFLISPLRRLLENPKKILGQHVNPGMTVVDFGCAMGFWSLPLAEMVGPDGRVVCVDIQDRMLKTLKRRGDKAGFGERIEARLIQPGDIGLDGLDGQVDFASAIHVLHEMPDAEAFFKSMETAIKPGGKILVVEPKGHVKGEEFARYETLAVQNGFKLVDKPRTLSLLFEKI